MKEGAFVVMAALASEIEGMEHQLALIRRKLVALSTARPAAPATVPTPPAVTPSPPKAKQRREGEVGPADTLRIGLFLLGGRADRSHLTPATHALSASPTTAKGLNVPASLLNSGEVVRHRGAVKGHTVFEISDALKTLRLLKKHAQSYGLFKAQLAKGPERAEHVSAALLESYGKRARSFLISDFLKTVESVSDREIRTAVERSLPRVIAELSTKRAIELSEGPEGSVVSGKPVSKITWLGGS